MMELRDIDTINAELELTMPGEVAETPEERAAEASDQAGTASEESPRLVSVAVDTPEANETIH